MKRMTSILLVVFVISAFAPTAFSQTATVIKNRANLYAKPNTKSKVIKVVKRETTLNLVSSKPVSGWYQVFLVNDDQLLSYEDYLKQFGTYYWVRRTDVEIQKENESEKEKETEWVYLYSDNIEATYYSPKTIQQKGKDEIVFWLKKVIIDKEAYWDRMLKSLKIEKETATTSDLENADTKKAMDISHNMLLYRANCREKTFALQSIYTYSIQGEVWWSSEYNDELKPVIPESNGELFVTAVCQKR